MKYSQKIFGLFACLAVAAGFLLFPARPASAQLATKAFTTELESLPTKLSEAKKLSWDLVVKTARYSFGNSIRTLLNQFAYDTATYIGTGSKGQKPVYFTESFDDWIGVQGQKALGHFVEDFARIGPNKDKGFIDKYGICAPNFALQVRIGLGLVDYSSASRGLSESQCNMKKIWEAGNASYKGTWDNPEYLANLSNFSFDPTGTDVGVTQLLFGKIDATKELEEKTKAQTRVEGQGWLNIDPFNGKILGAPGSNTQKIQKADDLLVGNILKTSGDIFVDAANIFLNQLALSAFQKLMGNLTKRGPSLAANTNSFYAQGQSNGVTEVTRKNSTILQAKFAEKTDYDVLSQLTTCEDEETAGPTNCVITQPFSLAISNRLTVADAIAQGMLNPNARVGYKPNGDQLSYKDGYPYRSLIILRKYRVLPVGWEIAADYMKAHPQETKDMTLGGLLDCFSATDTSFPGANPPAWCRGLVDPHWVLKLPKMFCGMQGYGSQILKADVYAAAEANGNPGPLSVSVMRNNDYCADEQSCIQEGPNGSCEKYGYCTEEKRQWVFDTENDNSCSPLNNTCQTFTKDGEENVSYLENTLDYSDCDASQVGCKRFASLAKLPDSYNKATKTVNWNKDAGQLHFNKDVAQCQANGEGCHEFIRLTDNAGTNLIADGSFEYSTCVTGLPEGGDSSGSGSAGSCQLTPIAAPGAALAAPNTRWYVRAPSGGVTAGIVNDKYISGNQSLYVRGQGGLYSKDSGTPSIAPSGFRLEEETYYVLSAYIYVESGTVRLGFGDTAAGLVQETTGTGSWVPYVVRFYNPTGSTVHDFFIEGKDASSSFYLDSVQLTKGSNETSYEDYGQSNVVYEKLLPAYLEPICYVGSGSALDSGTGSQYELKADAPAECFKFARKCADSEVGCQSYTATNTGVQITGKTRIKDLCPESCVGYDTFVQQANFFNIKQGAYFIPKTARTCAAQAAGCTAFTNLDALDQGGEAIEHYTSLRACIKPDASKCGQFYTWEGSDDEGGYQLHAFTLNKVVNGGKEEPNSSMLPADESQVCNKTIFQKTPLEAGYNYDCREFYAQDGSVSYHLLAKTITCSDNCHPYRREATQIECQSGGGTWDGTRCLYYAIPGEGTTCSAADAGCQEYTGNVANNTRIIFNDTFESANLPLDGWGGGQSSTTSLNPGGRSLLVSGDPAFKVVGSNVERNTSYSISFVAKAAGANTTINALNLVNRENKSASFAVNSLPIRTEWQLYTFNLSSLDHDVTPYDENSGGRIGERLLVGFSGPVYIDQIKLTAVPNRYYVIKNSWNTPSECDQDFSGQTAFGYMLGCSQYRRPDGSMATLHSFTSLCQDSAAGCEAMIDTQNTSGSKGFGKTIINDKNGNGSCEANEPECIATPADSVVNAVYDPAMLCDSGDKACQRLGLVSIYDGGAPTFSDVYLKNDPDRYATIACKANAVGCTQWTAADGSSVYFKDPGEEVCEWRLGSGNTYNWFKKGKNEACVSVYNKTIGLGGKGSAIKQPATWAGICQPEEAGCTEYIDPVSKFSDNIILNPSYQKTAGQQTAEHWTRIGTSDEATQTVGLTPQTLYVLKGALGTATGQPIGDEAPRAQIKISCPAGRPLQVLQPDNSFAAKTLIDYNNDPQSSAEFYIPLTGPNDTYAPVACIVTRTLLEDGTQEVYLRRAVTAYQLRQNLDRTSHNNYVNFDKGAILFNERTQSGTKKAALTFNADATYETGIDGLAPSTAPVHNANALIKVTPDRTCSKWLDCLTYIPDPARPNDKICLDIGECESFAPDGSCAVRVNSDRRNQTNRSTSFANLSGYSKVGYAGTGLTDLYRFSTMTQVGSSLKIDNGDFEDSITDLEKWTASDAALIAGPKSLSNEPIQPLYRISQSRDAKFLAPQGINVAKISKDGSLQSISGIDTRANGRYILSFYVYSQGGELKVTVLPENGGRASQPQVVLNIPATDQPGQWVRRSVGFVANSPKIKLLFEAAGGDVYVDDIKADISLNVRCSDPNANPASCVTPSASGPQPQYAAPSCRLYPTENSLSCSYTDPNKIKTQGVKGYCLESDPRNPSVCLLWYPVDRISGDSAEEGSDIEFESGKDVYYCVNAEDQCSLDDPKKPQIFCKQFVKVNAQYYWTSRLAAGSPWLLPNPTAGSTFFPVDPFFAASSLSINFGGSAGPNLTLPQLTPRQVDDFFGSKLAASLGNTKQVVGIDTTTGLLNTFVPYYASLQNMRCPSSTVNRFLGYNNYTGYNQNTDLEYDRDSNPNAHYLYIPRFNDGEKNESLGPDKWDVCSPTTALYTELNSNGSGSENHKCDAKPDDDSVEADDSICHFRNNIAATVGIEPAQCDVGPDHNFCRVSKTGSPQESYTECRTIKQADGTWHGVTWHSGADNNKESLCIFTCYNSIDSVKIAKDAAKPLDIIRRLFPQADNWKTFTWSGTGNVGQYVAGNVPSNPNYPSVTSNSMPKCGPPAGQPTGLPTRPSVGAGANNNLDYCYIPPIVSDLRVNGHAAGTAAQPYYEYVNNAAYVTFSYATKTDKEQTPLRKIDFDFGYFESSGAKMILPLGGPTSSFADITRSQTHRYEYETIKKVSDNDGFYRPGTDPLCLSSTLGCYVLTPKITITDNWEKYGEGNGNGSIKIVVRPLY